MYDLYIQPGFTHPGCECMPENVATEMRKQDRVFVSFSKHFIITIMNNTPQRLVQGSLMLSITEAIYENKVCIAIYYCLTAYSILLLVLLFL